MSVPQPSPAPVGPDLVLRVLYMVLYAVVFWILTWTVAVVAILQLILRVVNGRVNPEVARFGAGLGRYARHVIEFLTFVTETVPYPMAPWPPEQ